MNIIKKFLLSLLKKDIQVQTQAAILQFTTAAEERSKQRRLEVAELWVETPVIVVSNQWEDPIVGFVRYNQFVSQAMQPCPVVYDYLRQEEFLAFGTVFAFTEQRLQALVSLKPDERWALILKYGHGVITCNPDHAKPLTDLVTITQKLSDNGFYKELYEFQIKYENELKGDLE